MVFDIVLIIVGFGLVAIAVFAKNYYWGRGMGESPLSKQTPVWVGQLLFGLVGFLLILTGFLLFFGVIGHVR